MLRIIIYDKLDKEGRAIQGERRAYAAFSDEAAQQQFIADANLDEERIKFDYFDAPTRGLPESAQPRDICYALYKKWAMNGPFELSGYSYTKSFHDQAVGYDNFVMPVLINKNYEEAEAWKDAAIKARLGTGKAYREAKRALEKLPQQEREKKEAEFLVDFAQNTYSAIKPKTRREVHAVQICFAIAVIWIAMMLFFIPEDPESGENVDSVPWLPKASNVSFFRAPEFAVFEANVPWSEAQKIVPASFQPIQNGEIVRYNIYLPNADTSKAETLEMSPAEFEKWQNSRKATVVEGFKAEAQDGSIFLYDSKAERLYADVKSDSRSNF
ncbi:hypothetical protein [Rubellicoccus peritrichatus]|uniref:Uncharacterized protein n=1 Tax=Rubellicoccus peritrichatus TaxID=3080537 RepID=A0AAQ3LA17_9BACT|nr:hypothetical protein [Puniceicoccus sp. CR14]WOO40120.1 hypothetical protein RZN69_15980 [Puniceicoccus sp. CR14]